MKKNEANDEFLMVKMSVQTILERWPQTAKIFNHYSSACIGCAIAPFCTIADAARLYGLSLEAFVADLEKAIEGQELDFT